MCVGGGIILICGRGSCQLVGPALKTAAFNCKDNGLIAPVFCMLTSFCTCKFHTTMMPQLVFVSLVCVCV